MHHCFFPFCSPAGHGVGCGSSSGNVWPGSGQQLLAHPRPSLVVLPGPEDVIAVHWRGFRAPASEAGTPATREGGGDLCQVFLSPPWSFLIYTRARTHTHAHLHACAHTHTQTHAHTRIYIYKHVLTQTHTHIYIYSLTHTNTETSTRIHALTRAQAHAYTNT